MKLPPRMSPKILHALVLLAVVAAPVRAIAADQPAKPGSTPATEPAENTPSSETSGDKAAPDEAAKAAKQAEDDKAEDDKAQDDKAQDDKAQDDKAQDDKAEADEQKEEEASKEPGSEETGEDKPLNIAAIGSIATGTTGVLSGLMVVVVAVLQVPNPFLYPFYQSDLADAEARYRETRDYDQLRRAQEAQAGIDAVENGFANQAGVLLTSVAALLPAVVTLAVGITQLVVEE